MYYVRSRYFWLLSAAAITTFSIFSIRLLSVIKNYQWSPTSGLEGAGAYGVYLACSGREVYHSYGSDTTGYIFNFLFYKTYGFIAGLLGQCGESTPIVGHAITAVLVLGAAVILFSATKQLANTTERVFISSFAFSTVIGWWAFSIRPDIAGAVALGASVAFFSQYLRNRYLIYLICAAVFAIVAWSFKQPFLLVVPLMAAWLLIIDRIHLAVFLAIVLFLGGIVFAVLGQPYIHHTIVLPAAHPFILKGGIACVSLFLAKSAGLWACAAVFAAYCIRQGKPSTDNSFLLSLIVLSFLTMGVLSAKLGAADNYLIPPFIGLLLFIINNIAQVDNNTKIVGLSAAASLTLIFNLAVFSGLTGKLNLDNSSKAPVLEARRLVPGLPGPKLVWDEFFALPWVTGDAETHVFDELIDFEQASAVPGGDLRGRVAAGYYATVVINEGSRARLDLHSYKEAMRIGNILIFTKSSRTVQEVCEKCQKG
jgi:MFS family permease